MEFYRRRSGKLRNEIRLTRKKSKKFGEWKA
jgi:hypothetical protein